MDIKQLNFVTRVLKPEKHASLSLSLSLYIYILLSLSLSLSLYIYQNQFPVYPVCTNSDYICDVVKGAGFRVEVHDPWAMDLEPGPWISDPGS